MFFTPIFTPGPELDILEHLSIFAAQNDGIMTDNVYYAFASLLETGRFDSYEAICRELKVCPDDLDETLVRELGYTGNEVFAEYFGNRCKNY